MAKVGQNWPGWTRIVNDEDARTCTNHDEAISLPNDSESHSVDRNRLYAAMKLDPSSSFCSIFHDTNISCMQTYNFIMKLIFNVKQEPDLTRI